MIVCPNCKHGNPDGATNCEACHTALPATQACPTCGASIRVDATFCGQCGHNLKTVAKSPILLSGPAVAAPEPASVGLPPTVLTAPAAELGELAKNAVLAPVEPAPVEPDLTVIPIGNEIATPLISAPVEPSPVAVLQLPEPNVAVTTPVITQLQLVSHQLLHIQTNTSLEIPPQLQIVHLGKPNDRIPPDIDVSGFPSAEVVSRIHANIRVEGESYYIEDVGSANGTYLNHNILPKGNRHLLRSGDRIGLGKGDLVTFIFQ